MKGIVATDGSVGSKEAATAAESLFGPGMEYVITTVAAEREDPMAYAGGFEGPLMTDEEADRRSALADEVATNAIVDTTIAIETPDAHGEVPVVSAHLLHDNDPGGALCRLAVAEGADVIIIAASSKGIVRRWLEGSVVNDVLKHAPCPVLVVRH